VAAAAGCGVEPATAVPPPPAKQADAPMTMPDVAAHAARPGKADSPGPVKNTPADKLRSVRSVLGLTKVSFVEAKSALAVIDPTLE